MERDYSQEHAESMMILKEQRENPSVNFVVTGISNVILEKSLHFDTLDQMGKWVRDYFKVITVENSVLTAIRERVEQNSPKTRAKTNSYNPNGLILFEGASHYDGSPIVVIITGLTNASKNAKTGNILQTWILLQDISPCEASQSGADKAVCGSCPLRRGQGGSCYVTLHQAPSSIWKAYKRGSYRKANQKDIKAIRNRIIRIGAYGDPAAVPVTLWRDISGPNYTGYTHGWKSKPGLKSHAMASVENLEQMLEAQSKGWRTFRMLKKDEKVTANEIICPAVSKNKSCDDCMLCNGSKIRAKSIAIPAHGNLSERFENS